MHAAGVSRGEMGQAAGPTRPLTHSSSSTPSKESCGSGSTRFPSFATMALSSWERGREKRWEGNRASDPKNVRSQGWNPKVQSCGRIIFIRALTKLMVFIEKDTLTETGEPETDRL